MNVPEGMPPRFIRRFLTDSKSTLLLLNETYHLKITQPLQHGTLVSGYPSSNVFGVLNTRFFEF